MKKGVQDQTGLSGNFQRQAEGRPSFDAIDQNPDFSIALSKQDAGCGCRTESLMAVNQARFGRVDQLLFRIEIQERHGDGSRQVTSQPLGTAAHVDKLDGGIRLKCPPNLLASLNRDAGKFQSLLTPRVFVGERVAAHVLQANSGQPVVGFSSAICAFGDEKEF